MPHLRYEAECRNLPTELIMGFLVEAGGSPDGERSVSAAGWSAELVELPPAELGPVSIPRDVLIIEGSDEDTVEQVYLFMRRNLMRGGG